MLNGNMTGQYNVGANLPLSDSVPSRGAKPADYDALRQQFDTLASEVGSGPAVPPGEPATPAYGQPAPAAEPGAPAEGTSAKASSKALKGALKGAANAASDEEAIAMLDAVLRR